MIPTELESIEKISLHFDSFIQVKCIEMRLKRDYWKNTIHDDFLFNFHISSLSPHQTMKGHGVGFFVIYKKSYCGLIAALKKKSLLKKVKSQTFSMLSEFSCAFLHELCKCWVLRVVQKLSQSDGSKMGKFLH